MFKRSCSSNEFVINCMPTGRPFLSNPNGIEIAGNPARLIGTVKISFK